MVVGVSTWDDLKDALVRLRDMDPEALRAYPDPRVDEGRSPPFHIVLAPWAVDIAANLHDRFGEDVDLQVGFLDFPGGTLRGPAISQERPLLLPEEIEASVDEAIEVRSGHDAHGELHVANRGHEEIVLHTVTAYVFDAATDKVVGGFAGAQAAVLIRFPVAPQASIPIPMLIGTASFDPRLGYAIPPGQWAVEVALYVEGRGRFRTPLIPMTVVA
jgi:hypothetical protein